MIRSYVLPFTMPYPTSDSFSFPRRFFIFYWPKESLVSTLTLLILSVSIVRRDDINTIGVFLSEIIELHNVRNGIYFLFNCALGEK